ncbi:MAG: NAD(P)/FAD-dependent oxidoreductase [Pseudomonadota bacterium]
MSTNAPEISETLETDYLIIGCGAVGMAFADIVLSESDADIVIVDRLHKPGGHWNHAYPFVTLHQPSAFYGVSSRELSRGLTDQVGLNKGLSDMATGAEVLAYFDDVMRHQFLPSGRVRYFPMCEYNGDGEFTSLTGGQRRKVTIRKKIVDATWLNTSVPATHTPKFEIEPGVRFMPLNDLPNVTSPPDGYVVLGSGKTGIDACLWLLSNDVAPDAITWVMPRDAWLINRANVQPSMEFFEQTLGAQATQMEAMAQATSPDDLFDRLEAAGVLLRIDTERRPTMFHAATVSPLEIEQLRRIKNVVRMGRVTSLGKDKITLTDGAVPTTRNTIHIDCTASAVSNGAIKPVFEEGLITPQTIRSYQPVFSSALIAHIELTRDTDDEKNALSGVVPLPDRDTDWIRMMVPFMMNQFLWSQDKDLRAWLETNRLDGFTRMVRAVADDDAPKKAIMKRMRNNSMGAMANMRKFVEELDARA